MQYYTSKDIITGLTAIETLEAQGWTADHMRIREEQENRPDRIEQFEALLDDELRDLIDGRNITICHTADVTGAWKEAGLVVPQLISNVIATTLHHDGETTIVIDMAMVRTDGTDHDLGAVLVHEMVHYDQYNTGRMKNIDNVIWWEGARGAGLRRVQESFASPGKYNIAFMQCMLPWELEAYVETLKYVKRRGIKSVTVEQEFTVRLCQEIAEWTKGVEKPDHNLRTETPLFSNFGKMMGWTTEANGRRDAILQMFTEMNGVISKEGEINESLLQAAIPVALHNDFEGACQLLVGVAEAWPNKDPWFAETLQQFPMDWLLPEAADLVSSLAKADE